MGATNLSTLSGLATLYNAAIITNAIGGTLE
jgi:hypothetical protein